MLEIFRIAGRVVIDADDANRQIEDIENSGERAGFSLSNMADTAVKVGKKIAVGLAAGITALGALAINASDAVFEIEKFSQITGTTTEEFQRWDAVLKSVGYSMEDAAGDFAALGEKAMDAANATGEGAELFSLLGVKVTENNGKLKTQGKIFEETIKSLQSMEDITKRNAIASALLGTTGEELVPILNMTNEELEKMKDNVVIIDEDQIQKSKEFRLGITELTQSFSKFMIMIGIEVMPLISQFTNMLIKNSDTISAVITAAIMTLSTTISLLIENLNIILPLLIGLGSAFVALQVIGVVTKLMSAYRAVVAATAVSQGILNAVMLANPAVAVSAAIGVAIAALVLLLMNIDKVKEAMIVLGKAIVDFSIAVISTITTMVVKVNQLIVNMVSATKNAFTSLYQSVINIGTRLFKAATNTVKSYINTVFKFINKIAENVEKLLNFKLPDFLGGGDISISLPRIPMLANGGVVTQSGTVMMNEFEPEFVTLPSGATVTPLSRMSEIPQFNDSGTVVNGNVIFQIDAKNIKEINDLLEVFNEISLQGGF